ncbi:hypothetical protein KAU11_10245 [Candidatus Babeliales bacterium]|nr:hypothetical protein [Candidatus Babeliales bacterium]
MNRGEIRTELTDDLSTQSSDIFYTDTYLDRVINRAVKFAANRHPFKNTQRVEKRTIDADEAGGDYVNLPENWLFDSVYYVSLNDTKYHLFNPKQYQNYVDDEATGEYATVIRDRLFFGNTTLALDDVINIKGQEMPTDMSTDADEHVFYNDPGIEEAMIEWSLGTAYKKARGSMYKLGLERIDEAKRMLDEIWLRHGDSGYTGQTPSPRG